MFRNLMVPLDGSPLAEQALAIAASIARVSKGRIDLALVRELFTPSALKPISEENDAWKLEQKYLDAIGNEVSSGAGIPTTRSLLAGDVVDELCQHASRSGADLIVMMTHGRTGLSRAWLGSIAHGVLRHSNIPVLMQRPVEGRLRSTSQEHPIRRIAAAIDGSDASMAILPAAVTLAQSTNARLTLLRIVRPIPAAIHEVSHPYGYPTPIPDQSATDAVFEEARKRLREIGERLSEEAKISVDASVVVAARVAAAILDFGASNQCDVIAMATRGRGASRLIMGSVADKVARANDAGTLLYRPSSSD